MKEGRSNQGGYYGQCTSAASGWWALVSEPPTVRRELRLPIWENQVLVLATQLTVSMSSTFTFTGNTALLDCRACQLAEQRSDPVSRSTSKTTIAMFVGSELVATNTCAKCEKKAVNKQNTGLSGVLSAPSDHPKRRQ
uniref:Uncharacterized protein n=1 Tax=Panagrellus redivivus TaxID=6233 RepID=A0A7E4ZXJ5_PANRE